LAVCVAATAQGAFTKIYQNLPKFAGIDWAPVGSTAILPAPVERTGPEPVPQRADHRIADAGTLIDVMLDHQVETGRVCGASE
jgi:hypothetical protein